MKELSSDRAHKMVEENQDQVALAQKAAHGDEAARKAINRLIHPIITYLGCRFCKRFCHGNRYRYLCTLQPPLSGAPEAAQLCEFGNAGYAWMLEDLTHPKRLLRFEGRGGARINDYLYRIANSLPFYERWKDWRFGRRVHVPTYIQDLDPMAGKVFLLLYGQRAIAEIASELKQPEAEVEDLCRRIMAELTRRHRLYLLNPPRKVSLPTEYSDADASDGNESRKMDIPVFDEAPEMREEKQLLRDAWGQLSPVEQYVLEAMVIDEQDANDVLAALQKLGVVIKKGVDSADTNRQQLYYFRRKTLAKLAEFMNDSEEA